VTTGTSWRRSRRRAAQRGETEIAERLVAEAEKTAERTRQELRASGEKSGGQVPAARDRLSAQELQVAQMAATGMTNREIGQQLYLSPRTVGSHLYRLFPKLGITSRNELTGALGGAPEGPAT